MKWSNYAFKIQVDLHHEITNDRIIDIDSIMPLIQATKR